MFWVLLIAAILFLNIELRINSVTRKRSFYVLKLCIAGIKVYRAAFFIKKEKKDGGVEFVEVPASEITFSAKKAPVADDKDDSEEQKEE